VARAGSGATPGRDPERALWKAVRQRLRYGCNGSATGFATLFGMFATDVGSSDEEVGWQMSDTLVQRFGVLVAIGVTGTLLSGSVAAAQEDTVSAITVQSEAPVVEVGVSASAQPAPKVCQDPPCPPPPPPGKSGKCVLRIDPEPRRDEHGSVEVSAAVQCVKDTGASLVMRKLAMEVEVEEDGGDSATTYPAVNNASILQGTSEISHSGPCSYYQGFADAQLTWPAGWVGGRSLSVRTADKRLC
jgi:hypothetical protein